MNRRSFLASILAAGVAPAAIGSGILMPIKPAIVVPHWSDGLSMWQDASLCRPVVEPILMNGGRLWQDIERTIPVTAAGQPVAVMDHLVLMNGRWMPGLQRTVSCRPVLQINDKPFLKGDRVDDHLMVGEGAGVIVRVMM